MSRRLLAKTALQPFRAFLAPAVRYQTTETFKGTARIPTAVATRVSDSIKRDHRELEQYYNKIKSSSSDDEKTRWQNQFVWELARHSVAEELVVYPAFERHIPSTGHDMAEKDRSEHRIVKEKLYDFQSMSPSDSNFLPTIDSLWQVLSQHIREEERDDLPALEEHVDAGTSDSLARSFDRTKHFVPTRSHPSAPDRPPYETAAGMLATPMDKLMDMFRKFPEA